MASRVRIGPITVGKTGARLSVGKGKNRLSIPLNKRDPFTGRKNHPIVKVGVGKRSGVSWWLPVTKWWKSLTAGPSPMAEAPAHLPGGEPRERRQTAPAGAAVGTGPSGPSAPPGPSGEAAPGPTGTPLKLPDSLGKPGFLDLLAVFAEPATIYLGDAALPDGRQAEDLRAARLYIDILTVLREKTNGNLSAQERAVTDDLLYRLQMRYIQKRG